MSFIRMGRQSKATLSRVENLRKQKTRQKVTVEDITDSEDKDYTPAVINTDLLEEGYFFLDEDFD